MEFSSWAIVPTALLAGVYLYLDVLATEPQRSQRRLRQGLTHRGGGAQAGWPVLRLAAIVAGSDAAVDGRSREDPMTARLISCDDHMDLTQLPADLWTTRLPAALLDR